MASKVLELKEEDPVETGVGIGKGVDEAGAESAAIEVEGVEVGGISEDGALDLLCLALMGPRKVTVGSSRFQQFFFT